MNERFRQLGKESIVYGVGGAIGKFISFLLLPVFTRVFSPAEYGIIDVIATLIALAGMVLSAGTETALSYYYYGKRELCEQRKTVSAVGAYLLAINSLVALAVWIAADPIAAAMFSGSANASYLRIGVVALPFTAILNLQLNVLRLRREPWKYIGLSILHVSATLVLSIILVVFLGKGIGGVFLSNVIAAVVFAGLGLIVNWRYFHLSVDSQRLRSVIWYGLPLVVGGVSTWMISYLDRYALLYFRDLSDVGQYAVGIKIASIVTFVVTAFRIANAPFQFEIANDTSAKETYSRTLSYYTVTATILSVVAALFARPLITILAPESYSDAHRIVGLAALGAAVYGVYQIISVGLLITKKTGYTGIAIGVGAVLHIAYLALLVPIAGIVGAALATLLTHLSVVALLYIGAQRAYEVEYDIARVAKIFVLGLAFICLDAIRPGFGFWWDCFVALTITLLFVLILTKMSLVKRTEKDAIRNLIRRIRTMSLSTP